jgi:hypothetical protein
MHGGGSPEGAKLMVRLNMGLDQSINYRAPCRPD